MALPISGNLGPAGCALRALLSALVVAAVSSCDFSDTRPSPLAGLVPSVFTIEKVLHQSLWLGCAVAIFSVKGGPDADVLISDRKTRLEMFSRQPRKLGDIRKNPAKTFSSYFYERWRRTPVEDYAKAISKRSTLLMATTGQTTDCLKKSAKYYNLSLKYVYRSRRAVFTTGDYYDKLVIYIPKDNIVIVTAKE